MKGLRGLLALTAVTGLVVGAPSAVAAPSATPPSNCAASFDPYAYTASALSSCGYTTFGRTGTVSLPGGGAAYDYTVNGSNVRFYVPPAGFNPATATDAQLDEYGFPTRPTDSTALAQWQKEMDNWHGTVSPPPFLVETHATADTVYSSHWSGYSATGGTGTFTHAESWYYEPSFGSSACSSNAEVTWAGIGGYYGDALGQNGTLHNVPGASDHQAWWEVYPDVNIMPVNFYGHAGYEFDASTKRITGGYRFYFYNYYSGTSYTLDASINDYSGTSAEGIAERPTINGSNSNLSNFGTLTFLNTYANGSAINDFTHHGIHMTSNGLSTGTDLADPSGLGSGGYFTDTQHHCN